MHVLYEVLIFAISRHMNFKQVEDTLWFFDLTCANILIGLNFWSQSCCFMIIKVTLLWSQRMITKLETICNCRVATCFCSLSRVQIQCTMYLHLATSHKTQFSAKKLFSFCTNYNIQFIIANSKTCFSFCLNFHMI